MWAWVFVCFIDGQISLYLELCQGHTGQLTYIWLCSLCYWKNFYNHTLVHVLGKQHSPKRLREALLIKTLQGESYLSGRTHGYKAQTFLPLWVLFFYCQSKRTWLWFVKVALCLEVGWEAASEWALRAILCKCNQCTGQRKKRKKNMGRRVGKQL